MDYDAKNIESIFMPVFAVDQTDISNFSEFTFKTPATK